MKFWIINTNNKNNNNNSNNQLVIDMRSKNHLKKAIISEKLQHYGYKNYVRAMLEC